MAVTRRELIDLCLGWPGCYEDYPFDEIAGPESWAVIRHRGNKKIFAAVFDRGGLCVNLKCEPMEADFLRSQYAGVTPGWHMNKVHWNTVHLPSDVDRAVLEHMIDQSYRLTLPKKALKK